MHRPTIVRRLFGAAHFSKSLIWSSTDLLLLYMVHSSMGPQSASAGMVVFATMAYSCILDLPIAFLLTRFGDPRRQSIRLQAFAGPATGIALFGIFYGAISSSGAAVAIMTFVFRTAYAFLDVTHNALTTLLPEDADDTDRYVVTRSVLSALARLCTAAAGYWLVTNKSDGTELGLYVGALLAVLLTLTTAPLVWVARRNATAIPERSEFAISPRMWLIALAAFLQSGPLSIASRLLPFSQIDGANAAGTSLVAFILGSILAPMLATRLTRYVSRTSMWPIAIIAATLCGILLMANPGFGLRVAEAFASGLTNGILGYLIWSAASDEVRKVASKGGRRRDLVSFAALSTASKAAVGFAALVISPLLPGFVAGEASAAVYLVGLELMGAAALLIAMWSFFSHDGRSLRVFPFLSRKQGIAS